MDGRELTELGYRVVLTLRFLAFMATCYLGLHVIAARVCRPGGKVLAFFEVLTAPLTRPVRRVAPGLGEPGARTAALVVLGILWLVLAWIHIALGSRLG